MKNVKQKQNDPYVTVLRKIWGEYRWVTICESELTEDERRARYCVLFNIYG
jgi:hypothetical protein